MGSLLSHTRSLYGKLMGKQWKQWETLFWGAPKWGDLSNPEIESTSHVSCIGRQALYQLRHLVQFSSVQQLSCVWLCNPMDCSTPGIRVHDQLLEFTQTHVHWVSDDIQPAYPLLSPSPHAFNLSQPQGLFKWVSSSHQVAKVLEFQLHQSLQWTFRTDWLDLLSIQGTLKSLLQQHSSKVSIFWHSAFFIVQLSHPYMTTGKP